MFASVPYVQGPNGQTYFFLCELYINDPELKVCCNQALSQKEAEKAALTEKLTVLQQDLAIADMELERTKREAHSKHEQDKVKHHRVILALLPFLVLFI